MLMTLVFPKGKPQTPQHVLHLLVLAHLSSLVLSCFFNTLMQQYSASNYFYLFYFALQASPESPGSAPQPERDKFVSKQCKTLPFGGGRGFLVPFLFHSQGRFNISPYFYAFFSVIYQPLI